MPKQVFIDVQLAQERYDRCKDCPLCGLVPESDRQGDRKFVCLATFRGLTHEEISESNPANKVCGERWDEFMKLPKRIYKLRQEFYAKYRLPFEQTQAL